MGGKRFENSLKIIGGLFQTDKNKGFWANAGNLASRFTWESWQTIAGEGISRWKNAVCMVDRVDYLGGATFVTNENSKNYQGITLGNYINIDIYDEITVDFETYVTTVDPVYMHEYGHTIDSRNFGFGYLLGVGLPSMKSAKKNIAISDPPFDSHGSYWTEIRANKYAKKYFGKYYEVDWNRRYHSPNRRDGEIRYDNNGNRYWYYYTLEDYYPTN